MDPATIIGLVAASAQLVDQGASVIKALSGLYNDVKDAPTQAATLFKEMTTMMDVVTLLKLRLDKFPERIPKSEQEPITKLLNNLNELLQEMLERCDPKQVRGVMRRLKWPFQMMDTDQYIERIRRQTESLSLVLQNEQMLDKIDSHVREGFDEWKKSELSKEENIILDWLCPSNIDPNHDQEERRNLKTKNTATWIFQNAKYKTWLGDSGSFLWLQGKMGTGKSILSSSVIDKISNARYADSTIGLAFFYCDGNNTEKQDLRYILGSLTRQLLTPGSPHFEQLESLRTRGLPPPDVLLATLERIASSYSIVYIVLDGLDECARREALLEALSTLETEKLNFLVTSRCEKDIELAFEGKESLEIDKEHVQNDIVTHIGWMLDNHKNLKRIVPSMKKEIKEKLAEKSAGMFRWVQCQLDHLQTLKRDSARRQAINNLPPGLPETYRRILERIGQVSDDLEVAKKTLKWVIFCKRPLTLKELAVAIALDPDDCEFEKSRKLDEDEQILEICSSFVRMDEHTRIVEVAHFSVVEYFTTPILPGDKEQNPDFMDKMNCHAELLNCCLAYLTLPEFATGPCAIDAQVDDKLRDNELLEYAALKWPSHRAEVEEQPVLQQQVCKFFSNPCKTNFLGWEQLWRRAERRFVLPKEPNGLFYALEFDCQIAVQELLLGDGATFAEASRMYGNVLLSVANSGNENVVRKLLSANADLSVRDEDGWSALHFATAHGWTNIVEMLLDAKADVSVRDNNGMTALHLAAEREEREIVKMLLDAQADVSVRDNDGWTALHIAVDGDKEIVKMLLDAKANVSAQINVGRTALHLAAWRGRREIVKMLLDAQADVLVQDNDGRTALHIAVNRDKEIVKMLLDAKADVSAQTNVGRTALHLAALLGRREIVKMLLDAQADVLVQDNDGLTALNIAEDDEIVNLLLDWTAHGLVEDE